MVKEALADLGRDASKVRPLQSGWYAGGYSEYRPVGTSACSVPAVCNLSSHALLLALQGERQFHLA